MRSAISGRFVSSQEFAKMKWRIATSTGYRIAKAKEHPCADRHGHVYEHRVVVSLALGKPLRSSADVHHVNGDRSDNRNSNLVACHDQAYHKHLHARLRAVAACGNANWRPCTTCHGYDDPARMVKHTERQLRHSSCKRPVPLSTGDR